MRTHHVHSADSVVITLTTYPPVNTWFDPDHFNGSIGDSVEEVIWRGRAIVTLMAAVVASDRASARLTYRIEPA
jgi:hypothetical protein